MASESGEIGLLPITGTPWTGVRYGCTTRHGGISGGEWESFNLGLHAGDDRAAVLENRRRLRAVLPEEPFWLEQVHGSVVADADAARPDVGPGGSVYVPPRADAAVTERPGRVLCIMTADCVPVVIGDTQGRVLGAAHAGWRGMAAGILEATVDTLKMRLPNASWRAWVGPCIGQRHYEVGDDVRLALLGGDPDASRFFAEGSVPGKWQADLAGLACHRLQRAGVAFVEHSGLCTYARSDLFYSYRRSAVTGRMATLAWIEPL